jgi:signal transduction histidine kinase
VVWHWRIRHKLIIGLGLVVGILALMVAGSLKSLLSYDYTMKCINSKVAELVASTTLTDAVHNLDTCNRGENEENALRDRIGRAERALEDYECQLQVTVDKRRDPDRGSRELQQIIALHDSFLQLRGALNQARDPEEARQEQTRHLVERPEIKSVIQKLVSESNDLSSILHMRILDNIHEAKSYYREGLVIDLSTSIFGVLLMAGLLRFFYHWVFNPVRDLEIGAGRLAQGDFEHHIEVHSHDEMEDLAHAFNNMTGRLREMYRDLAHQVNERSRQLVRSERLASVGFLAAGVAHEINNPLASIAFCSEALEQRLADLPAHDSADSEVITKYLRMIQQEAFRCKAITQRLLEFSRSGERRREPTDLAELIQAVLDVVQHLQNYKGKQVIFELPGPVMAWVNAQEIKSVVLNLVVNALDSMDEEGRLTITLSQRDGMAEMVFADTGCGMSAEILENIFEPFFTRSRTGKGTGLGLSISHRVITQHAGEIEATSAGPGQGSTFVVRLPLQPAEPAREESLAQAA